MNCPHCQNTTDPDSVRCLHCGKNVEHTPRPPDEMLRWLDSMGVPFVPPFPVASEEDTNAVVDELIAIETQRKAWSAPLDPEKWPEGMGVKYTPPKPSHPLPVQQADPWWAKESPGEQTTTPEVKVVELGYRSMKLAYHGREDTLHDVSEGYFDNLKNSGMLWEFYPDAPENFPDAPPPAPRWAVRPCGAKMDMPPGPPMAWFADRDLADSFAKLMHPSVVEDLSP